MIEIYAMQDMEIIKIIQEGGIIGAHTCWKSLIAAWIQALDAGKTYNMEIIDSEIAEIIEHDGQHLVSGLIHNLPHGITETLASRGIDVRFGVKWYPYSFAIQPIQSLIDAAILDLTDNTAVSNLLTAIIAERRHAELKSLIDTSMITYHQFVNAVWNMKFQTHWLDSWMHFNKYG